MKGIRLPGVDKELCISQYADDNTLFCSDEESVNIALGFIDIFSILSGLYLNWNKTEGIWIGNWKYKRKKIGRFKWNLGIGSRLKILGVTFANNESAGNIAENWESRINNIEKLANIWVKRNLSMCGRIIIVKSLMLSKLTHLLSVFTMPEKLRQKVDSIMFRFIWNLKGKTGERVKRDVVIQAYECGGLKMATVEIMQKACILSTLTTFLKVEQLYTAIPRWLMKLFCSKLESWTKLNTMIGGLKPVEKITYLPRIYKCVIEEFLNLKGIDNNVSKFDLIWNNENVKYKDKVLYFKSWIDAGLMHLEQVLDNEGKMLPYDTLYQHVPQRGGFMIEYNVLLNALRGVNVDMSRDEIVRTIEGRRWKDFQVKNFRDLLTKRKFEEPNVQVHWNSKFPDCDLNWPSIWDCCSHLKMEARILTLQWKILHNVYPTNVLLKRMGKSDTDMCRACNDLETVQHFFGESCIKVKSLWKHIDRFISVTNNERIRLTDVDILFGYKVQNVEKHIEINRLILLGKLCISKFKYGKHANLLLLFEQECRLRNIDLSF